MKYFKIIIVDDEVINKAYLFTVKLLMFSKNNTFSLFLITDLWM
jgi:hypothetical protein